MNVYNTLFYNKMIYRQVKSELRFNKNMLLYTAVQLFLDISKKIDKFILKILTEYKWQQKIPHYK